MDIKLSTIIISYNRLEYLKKTVESYLTVTLENPRLDKEGSDFILIDNASEEPGFAQYLETVAKETPFKVIINPVNVGWGAAVNQALKEVKNDWILLSNSDVIYNDSNWLARCVDAYERNPSLGILGLWNHTAHGSLGKGDGVNIKDNMPAVGWFLKRDFINKVGLLEEHGPCSTKGGNGEDTEYCGRAIKNGYLVAGLMGSDGTPYDAALHITGY